ncbi:N-formylglutamate amidohydrolase [Martelella radicis]|uniref:Putative N-formylglutamate amidohydrolase n=1 Tax=Martelella radicis TaxID=1397476 RepID=A0A7W6KKG6_9HYPH|nr:N-formylglutamate amidohydrolase [Martelella radicis]MBB4121520.1 putative N-formylglutamate amidohydrolase [Martelella radicis]
MPKINAYERIEGKYDTGLVLLADHAMASVPCDYGDLGLEPSVFSRHVAYDIGVEALTRALSARLSAPAVLSTFSRLLIDPNRGEDDPTLIMKISDGAIIPANHPLSRQEREKRLALYHRPYHEAVDREIGNAEKACGRPPLVISLHSFTPFWKATARPWHAGILWDGDPRAVRPLLAALGAIDGIVVGDNEPYDGALKGDTMNRHCMAKGIAHALVEIRQDLIADNQGIQLWTDRLVPILDALAKDETLHARRHFPSRTR